MVEHSPQNTIAGWDFTPTELSDAVHHAKMLNPSIDLSNPCNLNCPYCFIEEKNSSRKLRKPNELTLDETLRVIDDLCAAGAETINIVGAGEPTIDPHFRAVVEHIYRSGLTTVLFTNAIALASTQDLVDFLYASRVSVVVKVNSFVPELQDLVAGRSGYATKRDRALELLIDRSFTAHMPTRLGIDTLAFNGNLAELPKIHEWARRQHVFPIIADYIPTGRTDEGLFQGFAAIEHCEADIRARVVDVLSPITNQQRAEINRTLALIDERYGVERRKHCAYYSGGICTQLLGVYVDIEGNIWPCVARKSEYRGKLSSKALGNVRGGDLPSAVWRDHEYMEHIRRSFSGECPYKPSLPPRGTSTLRPVSLMIVP